MQRIASAARRVRDDKEVSPMENKKPSWKEWLSSRTTAELMRLALFFQCIALGFQIAALILTIVRLVL